MKNIVSFLFVTLTCFTLSAQKENATHCYEKHHNIGIHEKSNVLTVAQIAETEKYNVHYYSLDIAMNNLVTHVAGTAEIHATANQFLDSALFELFATMNISEIRVDGVPVVFSRALSAVKAPVNASTGQSFVIAIDYDGTPPTGVTNPLGGSGMSHNSSQTWGNQVTWSLSESFSAYEWWPCKQLLSDKADSSAVKITVPNNCKAGSNGLLQNVVDLGNGTSRYEWKQTQPIDYYLISVAVAEYVEYNTYANPVGAPGPILIQNYIYNNPATLPFFQADLDETASFIELFSDLIGMYPFYTQKYGHCMAPIGGGMEHQTMTTQSSFSKSLTAHELGHQWFGDNVTCASWADIWVNEGFASYLDFLMIENLYPAERAQYMLDVHSNVMSQPDGSVYVLDSLNEGRIFSSRLTYDKGSSIIHTMRFMMNNDVNFFQALKNIQIDFADSVAVGLDVKAALENTSGLNMTNLFNEWYFGEGYPTYSARWNNVGSTDIILELTHSTSMPSITPTFTNDLEVKFTRMALPDTTIRFSISSNLNQFYVPNIGAVLSVSQIDPNNWIVNKVGTKVKDPNFVLGVSNITTSNEITVFPNPTNDYITVRLPNDATNYSVKLLDLNGKILSTHESNGTMIINLSHYSSNSYFVVVENNGTLVHVEKVLKN